MRAEFPAAVPQLPVTDMARALDCHAQKLGFQVDSNPRSRLHECVVAA